MKKLISLVLAVMLVLALAIPAMAATPKTSLTINEPSTDYETGTYAAYKLLNATNNADDKTMFSYTLNDKYTDILAAAAGLDPNDYDVDGTTGLSVDEKAKLQADIIDYIGDLTTADAMHAFAKDVYDAIAKAGLTADVTLTAGTAAEVDQGYWLIAQTSAAGEEETESLVMIDTAGLDALTIESKKDIFSVDKSVTDESQLKCGKQGEDPNGDGYEAGHVHTAACYDWSKTNESPIGATVNYKIETTVPANMAGYQYNAFFIVGDKLGQGLDLVKNSIKVYIGDSTTPATKGTHYNVRYVGDPTITTDVPCEEGYTFQVALVDPKANAGKKIVIYYDAIVNEDAILTLTGNPNEADVTYNPDDDEDYGGDSEDGWPQEEYDEPEGKTPGSTTLTYATGVEFLKVDAKTGEPLNGAEFTITGTTETTKLIWKQEYKQAGTGETPTHYLLKDGSYTTQDPVTADRMDVYTTDAFDGGYVKAETTDPAADTDVTISGTRYRVAVPGDFGTKTIYKLVKANADKYASDKLYVYSEGWEEQTETKDLNVTVKVDENGLAKLPGLGAGTYTVTESKVPQGYNKIDDFEITIAWTAPDDDELTAKGEDAECTWTVKVDGEEVTKIDDDTYLYEITVENNSGTELPSTGGIGTTIFYVLGSVLLLGAAVLLITKKRMSTND